MRKGEKILKGEKLLEDNAMAFAKAGSCLMPGYRGKEIKHICELLPSTTLDFQGGESAL